MEELKQCPVCGSQKSDPFLSTKDFFLSGEEFVISKCGNCGFRFTNPRPEANELGRYYQSTDYISHSDTRKGLFASVYQLVRKYTLSRKYALISNYHQNGKILDIGCATGQFLHYMESRGWETAGIEPDEKTRNRAITEFTLNVFPEEQLDVFEKSSFDVISMWHVLEHVSALDQRMDQLKRLLKPDGTLVIALPNCNAYDARKYGKFWAGYDVPRHLYHFTRSDVEFLFGKYGFKMIRVLPMRFDAFYVSLLSEKYKTGKMRWLPALWNGFWSNAKAGQKNGFSSHIYLLKTK